MNVRRNLRLRVMVAICGTILLLVAIHAGIATGADGERGGESYTIGLFGDMPYNALGKEQFPNLLADINASHVAFSVFDGDLKAGADGPCDNSLYLTALANFNTLKQPLVWLPGDNDWTDCWGAVWSRHATVFRSNRTPQF